MGNFLSAPKTEKTSQSGLTDPDQNLHLSYCSCSMQGWRRTMEDALKVEKRLRQGEALFAVFDGHGGREVAQFCALEIVDTLQSLDSYASQDYEEALRECFIALDHKLTTVEGQNKIIEINKQVIEEMRRAGQEFVGGDASDDVLRKIA